MPGNDLTRAADHWGDARRSAYYALGGVSWTDVPAVRRRLNAKISGSPERDWIDHVADTVLAGRTPVERCLSLCCGEGGIERALVSRGVCRACEAYDVSAAAIAAARRLAAAAGCTHVRYTVADVNALELPENAFDLVVAHHALHHIHALEHVIDQTARCLMPAGRFVLLDYVGPSRFGFSARRHEVMDAALQLLPERYRRSVSFARSGRVGAGASRTPRMWFQKLWAKLRTRTLWAAVRDRARLRLLRAAGRPLTKTRVPRVHGSEMAIDDPSEAARSAEILPVVRERLQVLEEKPCGGGLLMWLLDDIAGNFANDDPVAQHLLQTLFELEDALLEAGEVESDIHFLIAARPAGTGA